MLSISRPILYKVIKENQLFQSKYSSLSNTELDAAVREIKELFPAAAEVMIAGNICRSPIAEACLKQLLEERGVLNTWLIDSAATSRYQIGDSPDERAQACMRKHNTYHHVEKHRARQITAQDFDTFDYIFGMDNSNMRDLERMAPRKSYKAELLMLGRYDDDKSFNEIIEDPYYGDDDNDFEVVYQQCLRSCKNFLTEKQL